MECLFQYELSFRGRIEIDLEFDVVWNWPRENTVRVPVDAKVICQSLHGIVRQFYQPLDVGKSWYCFVQEPWYKIVLDPIMGKQNKVQLNKIPHVEKTLISVMKKKVRKFVWPNQRKLSIPLNRKSRFCYPT